VGLLLFALLLTCAVRAADIDSEVIDLSCGYVSPQFHAAYVGVTWQGRPPSVLLYWGQVPEQKDEAELQNAFFKQLYASIEKKMDLFCLTDRAYRTNQQVLQDVWHHILASQDTMYSLDTYTAAFVHLVGEHVATFVYRYDEQADACRPVLIGEEKSYRVMHEKIEHLPIANTARCYSPYVYEMVAKQKNKSIFELGEDMCAIYDGEPERYGTIKGMIVVDTAAWRAHIGLQSAQKDKAAPRCILQ